MRRPSIRLRVTLAFTAAMAVVLAAVGLFLYLQLRSNLDDSIDSNLRTRAGEVSALVRASQTGVSGSAQGGLIEQEESFAQVLSSEGEVVDSTPQLGGEAVVGPAELVQVGSRPRLFERDRLPGVEGQARLLAAQAEVEGRELFVLAEPEQRLPVSPAGDELSRLGETLNEMLARLEASIERERRFVNDASHELRTPLALHKTELELALRHGGDARQMRGAISSAIEEVDRLIQLAEDLLVVARSEEGKLEVRRERLAVRPLFDTVARRFATRAEQLGRLLEIEADGDLTVEADRLRVEQALTNIVDNALRYGEGTIRLGTSAKDGVVRLRVSDEGAGFPPEFIDRAFERFSRSDSARGRGATGLGLAIVETIARAHGGGAGAANRSEGGAEVWIELDAGDRPGLAPPRAEAGFSPSS